MLELRRQIMERLGETSVSKCKLVRRGLAKPVQRLKHGLFMREDTYKPWFFMDFQRLR